MADCECLAGCLFFNDKLQNMPSAANSLKKRFCRGDNANCARHMVLAACGRERVPPDLSPNQQDRARAIIGGGK
jgi:hypothetical protein